MLKLGRVTKVKVLFLVLVFVFNFDLFKFSAAILEKGLFTRLRVVGFLFLKSSARGTQLILCKLGKETRREWVFKALLRRG